MSCLGRFFCLILCVLLLDMLQSLLQPRENQRAVAARHERRRAEKRVAAGGRRPSQLPLQVGGVGVGEATPSPDRHRLRGDLYVCGKVAALHAVVGLLLLGIVVLVVGLVQLSPGAEAAQHRYYLMGCGGAMLAAGLLTALLRCICLHWFNRKFQAEYDERVQAIADKKAVSVLDGHAHAHTHDTHRTTHEKRLKTQVSVGREADVLIKQATAIE